MASYFWEKQLYGDGVAVVKKTNDCAVYDIKNESGKMRITSYPVFPGVYLTYHAVHLQHCVLKNKPTNQFLVIHHCQGGRIEFQQENLFYYLSPGDISISRRECLFTESFFPTGHYSGISILIDITNAPACFSCILDEVDVRPSDLFEKYCCGSGNFIMRTKPCLEHIFSELYCIPECVRKGYFKIKILELLLFLSGIVPDKNETALHTYSSAQVRLAKAVTKYLGENMSRRITIGQLASHFYVSQTQIKNSFRGVYGTSVYAYVRTQKMQSAAQMLRNTNLTVLEIAGEHGYDNGSKFAGAFRSVMGVAPAEYRLTES